MKKFSEHNAFSETLKAISSKEGDFVSLEKRKQTIQEMKAVLFEQQKGLGLFIKEIYDASYKNSALTFDTILSILEKYSQQYGFSEDQLDQIHASLKNFWRKHSEIEGEKALYKNSPEKFFLECFNQKPQDAVKIIWGYMTVGFILSDRDYNFAYVHNMGANTDKTFLDIAKKTDGAAFRSVSVYKFPGMINIFRSLVDQKTVRHEDQHQFNRLFTPEENRGQISQAFLERIIEKETTKKARRQKIIFSLAKNIRKYTVDVRARDEILSKLRNYNDLNEIYSSIANRTLYKYVNDDKIDWAKSRIKELFSKLSQNKEIGDYYFEMLSMPRLDFKYEDFKSPTSGEIKTIVESAYQGYYLDLRKALDAVKQLKEHGLTNEDIVPLLQAIPLDRWTVFTRRFLNHEHTPKSGEPDGRNLFRKIFDYKTIWQSLRGADRKSHD